jgi:hypothetical protein
MGKKEIVKKRNESCVIDALATTAQQRIIRSSLVDFFAPASLLRLCAHISLKKKDIVYRLRSSRVYRGENKSDGDVIHRPNAPRRLYTRSGASRMVLFSLD